MSGMSETKPRESKKNRNIPRKGGEKEDLESKRDWTFGLIVCNSQHPNTFRNGGRKMKKNRLFQVLAISAALLFLGSAAVMAQDEEACYEFIAETAWSEGDRYITRGNWATYSAYEDGDAILYAGQNIPVGVVTFTEVFEGVEITIGVTAPWIFDPVEENVKIQDYELAPSGNPRPGQFGYKASATEPSFTIIVPANNFYGVHVNVGQWVEVECPPEEE
jgi:hypothetical protein